MTAEVRNNKHGKSRSNKGGGARFSGLYRNENSLQKLVRTTHIRAAIYQKLLQSVNLEVDLAMKVEHHSNKPSEISLQEADVLAVLDILQNTSMNPFTQDDGLYIISSGA